MSAAEPTRFPDGFTWGTATAAHQIEGGNWNNDWWRWEHTDGSPCAEPSGDACDSWNRWEDDADLVASLGLDNYRFSIEWSRIEPEDGQISVAALERYRRQCEGLRERGVDPVVTFHHFTTPRWLADRGGWASTEVVDRFGRFCDVAAGALHDVMARACTINEPNVVAQMGWLHGIFPPGERAGEGWNDVADNFIAAHRRAVESIRGAAPGVPVGLTVSMTEWVAVDGGEERLERYRWHMEDRFLEATSGDDFVGVQTYSRTRVGPEGRLGPEAGERVLDMGYEFWPQALGATLRRAWEVTGGQVPLLVTENGIGTEDDRLRLEYLPIALEGVLAAIADGIDVRGYTCWSLLDNFEWVLGYGPKFGLVEVDRSTFERRPKPSAAWFAEVARANAIVLAP